MSTPRTSVSTFVARRRRLADKLPTPALIAAGAPRSRNYPANTYPFRAKSHFLYLLGEGIPGAALLLANGKSTLFVEPEQPDDALWTGPRPGLEQLRHTHELDEVRPLSEIDDALRGLGTVATLPTEDASSSAWLTDRLHRNVLAGTGATLEEGSADAQLADAMIGLRLRHDEGALAQLRFAADITARAHVHGMRSTRAARRESDVYGAMIGLLRTEQCGDSYGPIVSIHGEVLHNERYDNPLRAGDLLLADVGAETPEGWAGDITRTWPVSGKFTATQRALYEVVLASQKRAVSMVRSGVSYRDIHLAAARTIVEGLRDLRDFHGQHGWFARARSGGDLFSPRGWSPAGARCA